MMGIIWELLCGAVVVVITCVFLAPVIMLFGFGASAPLPDHQSDEKKKS